MHVPYKQLIQRWICTRLESVSPLNIRKGAQAKSWIIVAPNAPQMVRRSCFRRLFHLVKWELTPAATTPVPVCLQPESPPEIHPMFNCVHPTTTPGKTKITAGNIYGLVSTWWSHFQESHRASGHMCGYYRLSMQKSEGGKMIVDLPDGTIQTSLYTLRSLLACSPTRIVKKSFVPSLPRPRKKEARRAASP